MTRTVLARVIGANKVRRRPFKTRVRSAAGPSRAPSPGARAAIKRQAAHSPGATQPAPTQSPQPNTKPSRAKYPGRKSKTGQHRAGAALC